ncbi:MAG: homocysteine S-methyltransferase family protein [Oscillospiraceae bacterium]|nr:homocysteine S-methyltransferase family protein [Oscillospiraceae bacterium]
MKRPVILDGAFGSLFIRETGLRELAAANVELPAAVRSIHERYARAGSEIVYANSFSVNPVSSGANYDGYIRAAITNARAAVPASVRVGLDIAPLGMMLAPYGDLEPEEAARLYKLIVAAGREADLASIETMTSLDEALIALEAAKNAGMTAFVTLTFASNGRTLMGETPEQAAKALSAAGADAVGMNCSVGPDAAADIAARFLDSTDLPVIVKPNNGLPDENGNYKMSPAEFADKLAAVAEMGASYVGGCCGTSPKHIEELSKVLK